MLAIIALTPFMLVPVALWLGKSRLIATLMAVVPAGLAVWFAGTMQTIATTGPVTASLPWAPSLGIALSFRADGLGLFFAILISGIGAAIVIFSARYFDTDSQVRRFLAVLFAFMGSMLGVVLADNLFAVFVFWELTGFTSFLLIGFEHAKTAARRSAAQAFLVTATGGMGLLAASVLMQIAAGSADLSVLAANPAAIQGSGAYSAVVILILLAAFTKSAIAPFHFWLPNAMAAPTPASAYLHSATMVKAGLYLVARMTPMLGHTMLWTVLTVTAGAITMVTGAWKSAGQTDLKRILAYSTISALGLIMMLLGIGTTEAVIAGFVYLFAHACYKGALFLVAGTLEHETGTRNILELGGLRRAMPVTALTGVLAACSMAGLPFFAGFIGKDLLFQSLLGEGTAWAFVLLAIAIGASALLGAAGLRAGLLPFSGRLKNAAPAHPVSLGLASPALALAVAGVLVGVLPAVLDLAVALAAGSVLSGRPPVHLALWHGAGLVLLLSLVTLAGVGALYQWRDSIRERISLGPLRSERVYTWILRSLDVVSANTIPALQSASLRTYVMVLVLTAASLLAVLIVWSGFPPMPQVTEVRPIEAAVALMTIAGAISAIRARATMTAVISLGVTGYGVAITFLMFGAPDLAMTQFSVETLTAVIFTLVFYHFRRFRSLSTRFVRLRDFAVAVIFGGSIALVLVFVGTAATPANLGKYFAANSAALAHGRNIVNVILVDFRALDTLGEITVLSTAALGVRALLQIGRNKEKP